MAKFFKHFGLNRKPPVPPTKDYDNGTASGSKQAKQAHFAALSKPSLQQDYTNPLDFVNEVYCEDDADSESVYMLPTEENVYSEPYESGLSGNLITRNSRTEQLDDVYDEVSAFDDQLEQVDEQPSRSCPIVPAPDDLLPVDYDEPLEWGAAEALQPSHATDGSPISSSSSQCTGYPNFNYDGSSSGNLLDSESSRSFEFCEENDMPIRHIYETAFDSKVKRETEDIDRLTQSPILHGESSSSTSSPGSVGRETRVKSTHNGHLRNGKSSKSSHHHARKNERLSPAQIVVTAGPSALPPDLPKPKLNPEYFQRDSWAHNEAKTERRPVSVVPERAPPPKPNSLPNQILKIKAIIEPAPTSIRSYSSSSSSSLEEQKQPVDDSVKLAKFSVSKQFLNGNAAHSKVVQTAIAEELTSVLKNRLKMNLDLGSSRTSDDAPSLLPNDNNNTIDNALKPERQKLTLDCNVFKGMLAEIVTNNGKVSKTKHARTPNGTNKSYEICPKCCQPIVAEGTPQKKTSRSKSMEAVTSFSIREFKSNGVSYPDSGILCKCNSGSLQSPENDTRPLTDYDNPWDMPKRFGNKPSTLPASMVCCSFEPVISKNVEPEEEAKDNGNPEVAVSAKQDEDMVEELRPLQSKLNFQDFDRNSAPAALNKLGAEPKTSETVVLIPKSPSETQLAPIEAIVQGTKPKLNGLGMRKNLNLNFNTTVPQNKNMRQSLALNFGCTALTAKGETVDPSIPLEEQGWYHGSISRIDAENSLRVLKEGSYLVRNSESSKQDYSLSLKSARGFMHMKIVNKDGQYILGQYSKPFNSIPEMINHYSDNKLPIRGAEHMSLLFPVIGQLL